MIDTEKLNKALELCERANGLGHKLSLYESLDLLAKDDLNETLRKAFTIDLVNETPQPLEKLAIGVSEIAYQFGGGYNSEMPRIYDFILKDHPEGI